MMQWFPFTFFGLTWLLITIANVTSLINARRYGDSGSLTLIIGGCAGVIAMLVCPIPDTWMWAWVPVLLDPGSILAAPRILNAFREKKRKREADQRAGATTPPPSAKS